jgi:beta-glucosidase
LSNLFITKLVNGTISPLPAIEATNMTSPGGNINLWTRLYKVSVTVSNTGTLVGAAVPQLYLALPSTAGEGTPVKQLRGFDKIQLAVNESKIVEFELMRRDISYWDVVLQEWRVPSGNFGIQIGFSSRDLRVQGSFTI